MVETVMPLNHDTRKKCLHLIYCISFIDLCAVGIIFPTMGSFIRSLGCSHSQVGILSSVYAALQVFSGPIIGSWSDIRGRKSVFLITLTLSAIFYFLMGFTNTVWKFFTFRLLLGIFKHTQTINKAIIADLVGDDKKANTMVYGRCTSFATLGFVIGPIIGGYLNEKPNGFQHICMFTAALFAVNIFLVYLLPDLPTTRESEGKGNKRESYSKFKTLKCELHKAVIDLYDVDWSSHWAAFVLKFTYILSTTLFFSHQAYYFAKRYEFAHSQVGYIISLVSIVGVISSFCMGTVRRKMYANDENATIRTLHGFIILTISFIGFYSSSNIYVLGCWLLPFGIASAALRIVTLELLFNHSEENEHGSLTGVSDSMMALGRFVAPITVGFLTDHYSDNSVMLCGSIVSFIGSLIALHLYVKLRKEKEE